MYAVYYGDLLLASGSESFDVGNAVLLGVSTDRYEYTDTSDPVTATVNIFGTGEADINLSIRDVNVGSGHVTLDGYTSLSIELDGVPPGENTLEGVLTTDGLISKKKTFFYYGTNLPDLSVAGYQVTSEISKELNASIAFDVYNEGNTLSEPVKLEVFKENTLVDTLTVPALDPGELKELPVSVKVLGNAGILTIKGIVDPDGSLQEFNEANNTAVTSIQVPDAVIFTRTKTEKFRVKETEEILADITNLSSSPLNMYVLKTVITNTTGIVVHEQKETLSEIPAVSSRTTTVYWTIPEDSEEGIYRIDQYVLNPYGITVASSTAEVEVLAADFTLVLDAEEIRIKQGETASFDALLEPIGGFDALVSVSVTGIPAGATLSYGPASLELPGSVSVDIITNESTEPGTHTVIVTGEGDGIVHEAELTLDIEAFTLESDNASTTLQQLDSDVFSLQLDSLNGYEGTVDLSVDEVPFGMRAELDESSVEVPGTAELSVQTSKYLMPGEYVLTVTGSDGLVEHSLELTVSVSANPAIAAGLILSQGPGPQNEAWVRVLNADLVPVLELDAFETTYGASAVSADLNGDGYDEIVIAQGPGPQNRALFRVFSRAGILIGEYPVFNAKYGLTLSSGDLDGDWMDELVVGLGPDPKNPTDLKVLEFNGYSFDESLSIRAFDGLKYGVITAVGDIDGDFVPEILTVPGPGPQNPATVRVWKYDGLNLTASGGFTAFEGTYGATIATGDVDGDGIAEIVVGSGPNPQNDPIVRIFESDGSLASEILAYEGKYGYGANVTVVDLDGDGVDEIVTGIGPDPRNNSWVKIFRPDGTEITDFLGYPEKTKYGVKRG